MLCAVAEMMPARREKNQVRTDVICFYLLIASATCYYMLFGAVHQIALNMSWVGYFYSNYCDDYKWRCGVK